MALKFLDFQAVGQRSEKSESPIEANPNDSSGIQRVKTVDPPASTYFLMQAVAYYNLAVEYEHISDLNEALNQINQAMFIAKAHIGTSHALYTKIEECKRKLV